MTTRLARLCLFVLLACTAFFGRAFAADPSPLVLVLSASGPLNPAMKDYLERGIHLSNDQGAQAVVFQLDTPGGEISLMTEMVEVIRSSPVPVIVYVAPRGAMAGSAGTMITLAGHVGAMAPETAIGAASPVGSGGQDLGETMQAKTKNILKATARSLAERRGPEAVRLAEDTIEKASAVSAQEALKAGLIDFIAEDVNDLLRQADGLSVQTARSETRLNLAGAQTQVVAYSIIEQLLSILTNSTIVFLLLIVGVQAVLIEISSPGGWVAGSLGVICLALAGYGLGLLTVNWFGLVFLVLAFVLFILDINAPTHGALTAAGVGALIVSGLVLFNSPNVPSFQHVSVPLIVGVSISSGLIFFVMMIWALRTMDVPIRTGVESRVGRIGITRSNLVASQAVRGLVHLDGEQWSAELAPGEETLPVGTPVVVTAVQGLKLIVRKASQNEIDRK